MAERYLGHEMLVVGPGLKTGMPIRLDNPRELGADRLVNAVAALRALRRAVHRASTSAPPITFDVVSAEGEYLGGDHRSRRRDLPRGADRARGALPQDRPRASRAALIGKSTVDAIRSGVIYGLAAQVDGIVRRLRGELDEEAPAIATGGLAEHIVPHTRDDRRDRRPAHAHRSTLDP